ncbi:helix-turn-helix domain-containing protein [Paenibacillus arenilitoris]|uniref:Helix-turn-helix domain-containing protein n=1 Tax=Paenibacillus arenilitoris TaxID=2772299 RepID=A0A927CJW6_9BACL|nr:AraC family transcriptional regulator [Paenibacillus arenilitoris]MBD2867236.1 helix-turn-helix domain-containing protein [Paenibacillus arenilitoris]
MYLWNQSEERLNRFAGLLKGERLTFQIHYWGTVRHLTANVVHKHSFYEICYVNGGTATYAEGDAEYPLREGVLFCSRPGVYHQIKDVDRLDLLFVAFEPDETQSDANEFELYDRALKQGAVWLENQAISPSVQLWKSLLLPEGPLRPMPVSLLPQLAHALLVSFQAPLGGALKPEPVQQASNNALLINRAKLYIRDNLSGNLTLPEVAHYLNLSERHLSRLFAGSILESFSMLVRSERVRAAERLLARTNDPIKEIAERTGFASVHYFTRTFTRAKGISPAAFREASRRNE